MKTLHLSIILTALIFFSMLQSVHAQESPSNQTNVTLLMSFDSPNLKRCCDSMILSHDGSMLAYSISSWNVKSEKWTSLLSLYYFKNQTSNTLHLNTEFTQIYDLRFSHDDKKLLFVGNSCNQKNTTTTFYILNLSNLSLLCSNVQNVRSVDWFPDDSIVYLTNNEKNDTITTYQNSTGQLLYQKQIGPPYISLNSSHIASITTSPDGKEITLWYMIMYDHKTQILDVDTKKIITTFDGGHPEWSKDGNALLYTLPQNTGILPDGARAVVTYIKLLDMKYLDSTILYNNSVGIDFVSLVPNGTKVLFAVNPSEPYQFLGVKAGLYAIDLNNNTISTISIKPISLLSPLEQFKSGITVTDVKCSANYILTIKSEDGSPACVKPSTVRILTERGWAKFESAQSNHASNAQTNPFGIAGLIIYYGGGPCGGGTCPLNTFNLKITSNYTAYLLGYNICDGNICAKNDNMAILLPISNVSFPNFKTIALPEDLNWKYKDIIHIQVMASAFPENETATSTDLGNSTTFP